jgi:membrane fusion protein, multidrug efflux system
MEDRGSKSRSVRSKNWRQRHVGPMRWVFAVMIGTMALAGCGGEQDAAEATPTREAIKATNVAAMKVQPDSLTQVSRYPASVEAWRDVQVSFLESGPVSRILVDLGDRVQKGQLLATLHTSLLDAALIEAEAGAKFHRYNYGKSSQLFEDGTISERDLLSSEYDYKRAESNLATIKQRIKNSTLLAPFDGEVAGRQIEVGHLVGPSQPAMHLVQWDRVKMRAWVSESEVADFSPGREVDVKLDALAHQIYRGEVGRVGPAADVKRRVFPIEVHLDNAKGDIRPGMVGKLIIRRRTHEGVLVIPREAIVERETGPVAFVIDGETVTSRPLELGASQGNRVIALSGIRAGDQLVVSGGRDLINGERVVIKETRQ